MKASIWKTFDFVRIRGHQGKIKMLFVNQSAPFYHWWSVMEIFYLWGLFISWQVWGRSHVNSELSIKVLLFTIDGLLWRSFTFKVCSLTDKEQLVKRREVKKLPAKMLLYAIDGLEIFYLWGLFISWQIRLKSWD